MKILIRTIWMWIKFPGFILHEIGHFMMIPLARLFTNGNIYSDDFRIKVHLTGGYVCRATIHNKKDDSVYVQRWILSIVYGPFIMYFLGILITACINPTVFLVYSWYSLITSWYNMSAVDADSISAIRGKIKLIKNQKYDRSTLSTETTGSKESI